MKKYIGKRYTIVENKKSGKYARYNVFDTIEKRFVKGTMFKYDALGLEGTLNEKPHKKDTNQ